MKFSTSKTLLLNGYRKKMENHNKCNKLAGKVVSLEKEINSLNQYGWRNNIIFMGIPDTVPDDELEETVTSILSDIDVKINLNDIEDCHRFGKQDFKNK